MDEWQSIKRVYPVLDMPVIIKTNWKTYLARLNYCEFGGVVFHVFDSTHRVQTTTVTGWKNAQ